jgi:hypothetical protein
MSHYRRGVLDGIVHYCDKGWWTKKDTAARGGELLWTKKDTAARGGELLWPWCELDRLKNDKPNIRPAEPAPSKKAMITCLRCMWLRKARP